MRTWRRDLSNGKIRPIKTMDSGTGKISQVNPIPVTLELLIQPAPV
jgi:hypothetical protein